MLRALLLVAFLSCSFPAAGFPLVIAIGDSLVDSGNAALLVDQRTQVPIPSPTFVPSFPYESGRFSNGPVWVEQLAANLGTTAAPSLLGGTNFAVGGARTGPAGSGFSLLDQVGFLFEATGGVLPSEALYVVMGGANDARDAFVAAFQGDDPTAFITAYALNMASILQQLGAAGAEHILVANVPDIGKTPSLQALGPGVAALGSALALAMNTALADVLSDVQGLFDELILLDTFGLLNAVVANPAAFGMTDVTSACAVDPACILDPHTTFFWDAIHPTTAGHALLAEAALSALFPIPAPPALALLAQAFVLLACSRRRRE